jgi:hypothetical protein
MRALMQRAAAAFSIVSLLAAAAAADPQREACIAAYEGTQALRRAGKLKLALAQASLCADSCPAAVAADCKRWLREIDDALPSVVLEARGSTGTVVVVIDGEPPRVVGTEPVTLEPGDHRFTFRASDGKEVEERVTLVAGEHRRRVVAVLGAPPPPKPTPEPDTTDVVPPASYVLGGVGLAALVAAGVLAILGHVERSDLEDTCAPACTDADLDPIRHEWGAAGALTAVGGVLLLTAIVIPLVDSATDDDPPAAALGVGPSGLVVRY